AKIMRHAEKNRSQPNRFLQRHDITKLCQRNAAELEFFVGGIESSCGQSPRQKLPMLGKLPKIGTKTRKQKRSHGDSKNHDDQRTEVPPAYMAAKPEDSLRPDWGIQLPNPEKQLVSIKTPTDQRREQEKRARDIQQTRHENLRSPIQDRHQDL